MAPNVGTLIYSKSVFKMPRTMHSHTIHDQEVTTVEKQASDRMEMRFTKMEERMKKMEALQRENEALKR